METVLITGGLGFIGSNLSEALLEKGFSVSIIDNVSIGNRDNIREFISDIRFFDGDVRDKKIIEESIKDVDYIFHQAALPSVARSVKNPVETAECNIMGTLNILDAARRSDVKKIIYASSSSVYGDIEELPKRESMKTNPLSPYAVTKVTMEYYFDVFNKVYGLESIGLRYFNVYGPRQTPESEYAAVIPKFIKNVLNNEKPVIYGNGEQTRDFTFIKDVVQANILAMNAKRISHDIFNIAKGDAITINTLLDKINDIVGNDIKPIYAEPREGDILHSLADISKAREKIGYNPEYIIDDGLRETIEWFRERHV